MEVAEKQLSSLWTGRLALLLIAITAVAASLVIFLRTTFSEEHVLALIEWVSRQGALAPVLFVVLQSLVVVTLAPGFLLSFAAGFLFGFWAGLFYVWIGTVLGAMLAFTLAPLTFRGKSDRLFERFPAIRRLDLGFSKDGWKIVMFRCFVPFFPFKLSNYALGLTSVSIGQFTIGTALGIVPIGAFNVYLGSISANLSTLGAGGMRAPGGWVTIVLGGVAIVGTLIFITRRAQAIFKMPTEEKKEKSSCG